MTTRAGALALASPAHRRLIAAFTARLATEDPTGAAVAGTDPDQLARQAADRVLEAASTWVEHLGAFYDTEGVARLLARNGTSISRQAVHKRRLLALTTGSGQTVYPAFQFAGRTAAPGIGDVLEALPEQLVSRWTVASWLISPDSDLDGERPIDVLHDGGPEGRTAVVDAARRWAGELGR